MLVKYTGVASFDEFIITGHKTLWQPMQISEISTTRFDILNIRSDFNRVNDFSIGDGSLHSDDGKPTPEEYGEGPIWIDAVQYWSDGVTYARVSMAAVSNSTGFARHLNDIPNYTLHSSQGAVDAAERVKVEWLASESVRGLTVTPWGGASFQGVYLTVNAPDDATALLRLKSDETSATTDTIREFVKAGDVRIFNYLVDVTRVDFVAIDDNTTPDNNVEVEPI